MTSHWKLKQVLSLGGENHGWTECSSLSLLSGSHSSVVEHWWFKPGHLGQLLATDGFLLPPNAKPALISKRSHDAYQLHVLFCQRRFDDSGVASLSIQASKRYIDSSLLVPQVKRSCFSQGERSSPPDRARLPSRSRTPNWHFEVIYMVVSNTVQH